MQAPASWSMGQWEGCGGAAEGSSGPKKNNGFILASQLLENHFSGRQGAAGDSVSRPGCEAWAQHFAGVQRAWSGATWG